jgi:GNAT superfamily N-acetyltransferase
VTNRVTRVPVVTFTLVAPDEVPQALGARARDITACTQHHVGTFAGREVVLLTVDLFPDEFRVHEIQVIEHERRKHYGSAALAYAEVIAREAGRTALTLMPKPLEETEIPSREALIAWYEGAGYVAEEPDRFVWVKTIEARRT